MNPSFAGEASALFPQGRIDQLAALGFDFLEGRREGAYVWDRDGRRYLDAHCSAGTFNLGRRRPELAEELKRAMCDTDIGNFPLISREKAYLAKALAEFAPGDLECSIFSVVRGEAMDAACKIARGFTRRPRLITVDGGWYGQTGFALSLSQRDDRELFGPLIPGVQVMPFGDVRAAEANVGDKTAAVILEPIQAENHCREASSDYLRALSNLCRERGALLILDETQTGFGRTGTKFACEASGVTPDVLVLGEALGGGIFPIAVTLLTQRVNAFMNAHPLIHLSTFGGADIGCCVALKALELYEQDKPWLNAAAKGEILLRGIRKFMQSGSGPIRGVAGKGLLLSLDLGSPEEARAFCRRAAQHGLLAVPGQVAKHSVPLRPSLMISDAETTEILDTIRAAA